MTLFGFRVCTPEACVPILEKVGTARKMFQNNSGNHLRIFQKVFGKCVVIFQKNSGKDRAIFQKKSD